MKVFRACGLAAGPLFVIVFLAEGALKAAYDAMRHPVSSLALGPWGWVQTANFLVCGLLTTAFAVGLGRLPGVRNKIGAMLVGVWGIGLLGAGVFLTDPVSGFPPGTPALPDPPTTEGTLHDLFSVPAFFAIALACLVLSGGRGPLWLIYSVVSGLASVATFMMSGIGFSQDPNLVDVAGLWQRVSVITAFTWLTLLALGTRMSRDPRTPPGHS